MRHINNILHLEYTQYVKNNTILNCEIPEGTYKRQKQRKKIKVTKIKSEGNKAFISYDSLPQKYKDKVIAIFGDPTKNTNQTIFKHHLNTDKTAIEFFKNHKIDDKNHLPIITQQQYVAEASIFNTIKKLNNKKTLKNITEILETIPKYDYPHKLPSNNRSFIRKYQKYQKEGYATLIHAGFNNTIALKIDGKVADWWLANYMLPNKIKVPMLMIDYNIIKEEKNYPNLTAEAVQKWLNKEENRRIWYLSRHGKEVYNNSFKHTIKTKKDNWFPNCYIAIDGSKFDVMHTFFDKNGKIAYGGKLRINIVIDVYSEKIIGWSYSTTENHTDHFTAMKMAMETSNCRPYLLTYDNQSGHKSQRMQELYTNMVAKNGGTHYPNKAYAHNSPVESVFNRLQQQCISMLWFSDKQGIRVKSLDNQPNMDFVLENKTKLKNKEETLKAWEFCVKQWNDNHHPKHKDKTRNEVYVEDMPIREELGIADIIHIFWVYNKGSRYNRGGIKINVTNIEYEYEVYKADNSIDIEFRKKNIGKTFLIKYDPDFMSEYVALYSINSQGKKVFVANAEPKREHQVVPALMRKKDKKIWVKDYAIRNTESQRDVAEIEAIRKRTGITPERLIEEQETMIKMQHKLPKKMSIALDSREKEEVLDDDILSRI